MNDNQLHADVAGLRADLQSTNKNLERFATALEKTLDNQGERLRVVELAMTEKADRESIQTLRDFMMKAMGIIGLVGLIGLPTTVYLLAQLGAK